jgi:RNA polymerase sigma-70 factor (ECF subfamily)
MASIDLEYLQLVTRHQPAIYGYIRSLAPGADIEDILQETNLILWEKSESFQPGSNFKAFAFRIAHLKTLEALRSERRRHWLVFDSDLMESIAERQAGEDRLAESQQAALRQCLLALSSEEQGLIRSRYSQRKTVREIARETGRSEGALQQLQGNRT